MTALPDRPESNAPSEPVPGAAAAPEAGDARKASLAATLTRMEGMMSDMRAALDAESREADFRSGSLLPIAAAVLQVLAGGAVALALLDALLSAGAAVTLVKLGFATVFQLAVIAALLAARSNPRRD